MFNSKCGEKFRKIDSFGVKVNFQMEGCETYKTRIGATITIAAMIMVIGYIIYDAVNMFSYNQTAFSTTYSRLFFNDQDWFYSRETESVIADQDWFYSKKIDRETGNNSTGFNIAFQILFDNYTLVPE